MGSKARILCFHDGGIRCLSSLLVLQKILEHVSLIENCSQAPKPCEYFDLICGSGFGGVIALLLGRLEMSIEECLVLFKHVGNVLFLKQVLEEAMKYEIERNELDPDRILQHENLKCKTFVLAMHPISISTPVRLRSYESTNDSAPASMSYKIWEAAAATSSVPGAFIPVKIGSPPVVYISPAFGYKNPTKEAFDETVRIWGLTGITCIVSLGAGSAPPVGLQLKPSIGDFPKLSPLVNLSNIPSFLQLSSRIQVAQQLGKDTERVHIEFSRDATLFGLKYFRFNVPINSFEDDVMKSLCSCAHYLVLAFLNFRRDVDLLQSNFRESSDNIPSSVDRPSSGDVKSEPVSMEEATATGWGLQSMPSFTTETSLSVAQNGLRSVTTNASSIPSVSQAKLADIPIEAGETISKNLRSISASVNEAVTAETSKYGAGIAGAAVVISAANAVTARQSYWESKKSHKTSQAALEIAQGSAAIARKNLTLSQEVFAYNMANDQMKTRANSQDNRKSDGPDNPSPIELYIPTSAKNFPSLAGVSPSFNGHPSNIAQDHAILSPVSSGGLDDHAYKEEQNGWKGKGKEVEQVPPIRENGFSDPTERNSEVAIKNTISNIGSSQPKLLQNKPPEKQLSIRRTLFEHGFSLVRRSRKSNPIRQRNFDDARKVSTSLKVKTRTAQGMNSPTSIGIRADATEKADIEQKDESNSEQDENQIDYLRSTTLCRETQSSKDMKTGPSILDLGIKTSMEDSSEQIEPLSSSRYIHMIETDVVEEFSQAIGDSGAEADSLVLSYEGTPLTDLSDLSIVHTPLEVQGKDEMDRGLEQNLETSSAIEMEVVSLSLKSNILVSNQEDAQ